MPQVERHDGRSAIRTHYAEQGSGEPVVLLHGGLESGDDWGAMADALAVSRRVLRPDRRGHGRTPDVPGPYRYEAMAREALSFVERVVGGPAHWVGYSDGGICALIAAVERPELVRSIVAVGANFHHDGIVPAMAEHFRHPDPGNERLAPMRDAYAARSPDGAGHWDAVYRKVCAMALTGPTLTVDDLARIDVPVLVVSADDDVVDLRHTLQLYQALPDSRLAVVPSTSHALPHEAPAQLQALVLRFLDRREPQRRMPMRRRPAQGV